MNKAIEIVQALLNEELRVKEQLVKTYGKYSHEARMSSMTIEAYEEVLRKLRDE